MAPVLKLGDKGVIGSTWDNNVQDSRAVFRIDAELQSTNRILVLSRASYRTDSLCLEETLAAAHMSNAVYSGLASVNILCLLRELLIVYR